MTKSIFLQRLSATAQFILGFFLGIMIIAGISGTLIFAYYQRMSRLPQKPVFPPTPDLPETTTDIEPLEPTPLEETSEPEPEPEPALEPELPPNAYYAEVTWPEGLSLRAEPDLGAARVGGVQTKERIIILEDSADGKWQRVRLPKNGQEAWVKGGNTKRVIEQ